MRLSPGTPAGGAGAPVGDAEFAALIAPLGAAGRPVGVAVSGGADSMALALLAARWGAQVSSPVLALVVDHELRAESTAEAAWTLDRLQAQGIAARGITLRGLAQGPGLAARARAARYAALAAACRQDGIVDLLLGHHQRDQAETVLMRQGARSGGAGLAAMPALSEAHGLRLLRPLLAVSPARLRATLLEAGMAWVEDPSNTDLRALRPRLRASLGEDHGRIGALAGLARQAGQDRAAQDRAVAAELAEHASLRPEGFALLRADRVSAPALAALLRAIGGAVYPPGSAPLAALAGAVRPATLGGCRIVRAGRLGPGWIVLREAAAMAPPVPARQGAVWDRRFRLAGAAEGAALGALGGDSACYRRWSGLPAAILETLPALRQGDAVIAVPHLDNAVGCRILFTPPVPAAGAPFMSV